MKWENISRTWSDIYRFDLITCLRISLDVQKVSIMLIRDWTWLDLIRIDLIHSYHKFIPFLLLHFRNFFFELKLIWHTLSSSTNFIESLLNENLTLFITNQKICRYLLVLKIKNWNWKNLSWKYNITRIASIWCVCTTSSLVRVWDSMNLISSTDLFVSYTSDLCVVDEMTLLKSFGISIVYITLFLLVFIFFIF